MPIYEYKCSQCSEITELYQKISDPVPEKCSVCQGGPLQKVISQTSFILKGAGWYVTDYKAKRVSDETPPVSPTANVSSDKGQGTSSKAEKTVKPSTEASSTTSSSSSASPPTSSPASSPMPSLAPA